MAKKKHQGNIVLIVLVLSSVILLSFLSFMFRYRALNRTLLKQRDSVNHETLIGYVTAQIDCVRTQSQPCTNPIALLKADGNVLMPSTQTSLGIYLVQSQCQSADGSIVLGQSRIGDWARAKFSRVCAAP